MISAVLSKFHFNTQDLPASKLFDEDVFYQAFLNDLERCGHEVIIESPFITNRRVSLLMPILQKLKDRRVRIIINTRDPQEHDGYLKDEAYCGVAMLQRIGVQVIYTDKHHRKVAVIDRNILWEGSLNILSQNNSREVMRRTVSSQLAWQMVRFTKLEQRMN